MKRYFIRRTAGVFVTIFAVASLTFALIRLLPGGPVTALRVDLSQQGLSPQAIEAQIEAQLNVLPSGPLHEQYIQYMAALMQGDMGQSIDKSRPVADIVAEAIPWTVFIVVVSTVLMFAFGILLGAMQAYWEGSRFDKIVTGLDIGFSSVPFFVYAIIFIFIFGYQLGWFPEQGHVDRSLEGELSLAFLISVAYHAILPIASYTIPSIGNQALSMRGNSIQILGNDYVRVARLRGLTDWRIATRYVSRNAILPMYTGFLLLLGFRLGGTVVLEELFSYPGLGYYMIEGVNTSDYPLMMGVFLVITVALVIGVYVADLTYSRIDPRIQEGESSEAY